MARHRRWQRSPHMGLVVFGLVVLVGLNVPVAITSGQLTIIIAAVISLALIVLLSAWAWNGYRATHLQKARMRLTADKVDDMHHLEFEKQYVPALLRENGYRNVRTTPITDHGIDVVATRDGVKYGIQVKHTTQPQGKKLDNKPVQQAVAGIRHHNYKCNQAIVITNGYLTKRAWELAKDCECIVIDRDGLAEMIHRTRGIR